MTLTVEERVTRDYPQTIDYLKNQLGVKPTIIERSFLRRALKFVHEYCQPNIDNLTPSEAVAKFDQFAPSPVGEALLMYLRTYGVDASTWNTWEGEKEFAEYFRKVREECTFP